MRCARISSNKDFTRRVSAVTKDKRREITDSHLVVVGKLGPSIEVVETPMGRFEMDREGRGKVLCHVQEVVDMAREIVIGHRR